jgi:hypothetical protein
MVNMKKKPGEELYNHLGDKIIKEESEKRNKN